jgi:hypothetical protein
MKMTWDTHWKDVSLTGAPLAAYMSRKACELRPIL